MTLRLKGTFSAEDYLALFGRTLFSNRGKSAKNLVFLGFNPENILSFR